MVVVCGVGIVVLAVLAINVAVVVFVVVRIIVLVIVPRCCAYCESVIVLLVAF